MKISKSPACLCRPYEDIQDIKLFEDDTKSLNMLFCEDGDLYWMLKTAQTERISYETFSVSKEDYEIYEQFDNLYYDIINTRIYTPSKISKSKEELMESPDLTDEDVEYLEEIRLLDIEQTNQLNEELKSSFEYRLLVNNGVITWYSDEEDVKKASVVRITKLEDEYLLEFIRQSNENDLGTWQWPGSITIRFRNSGSKYSPFNIAFMKQFNNLQKFERISNRQIHIEEYLYTKKLQLVKKGD